MNIVDHSLAVLGSNNVGTINRMTVEDRVYHIVKCSTMRVIKHYFDLSSFGSFYYLVPFRGLAKKYSLKVIHRYAGVRVIGIDNKSQPVVSDRKYRRHLILGFEISEFTGLQCTRGDEQTSLEVSNQVETCNLVCIDGFEMSFRIVKFKLLTQFFNYRRKTLVRDE